MFKDKSTLEIIKIDRKRLKLNFPWRKSDPIQTSIVRPMNGYEENEMLKLLSSTDRQYWTPKLRRYVRKLEYRKKTRECIALKSHNNIIDQYILNDVNCSINESIAGIIKNNKPEFIKCNYTDRILKPFIFQDYSIDPVWLRVHKELKLKVSEKLEDPTLNTSNSKYPINYVYVKNNHIEAINSLISRYFWPGVNMASSLDYPEFSIVALYKNVIVGFGFLSPGENLNEGYISFLFVRPHWRRCGIASFMIYHLINTCLTWDITLHVSSSNPSMLLYQRFGFKAYKVLNGFYDKYLPLDSNESRQAVFLKLER